MSAKHDGTATHEGEEPTRRDILYVGTGAFAAVGGAAAVWPLIDQMSPDASALALGATEVNLGSMEPGQTIKVEWRRKPVFVTRRTKEVQEAMAAVPLSDLPDPEADEARVSNPEFLVVVGVCTHLGCIPTAEDGDFSGWFCPCHGSHYDQSGRIRKGPAPSNLEVPPYEFTSDTTIRIG